VQTDKSNAALLTVSLPALNPGNYKVVWRASPVDPQACLVDLVNRSNFVGRVALAHYCMDER
jgi:hypothetical protein